MSGGTRTRFDQQGTVLVCTLMVTTLLATLVATLALVITTDTLISANHRAAQQLQYASDAGLERAIGVLGGLADWTAVPGLDLGVSPDLDDGLSAPRVPGGPVLDLVRLTAERQRDSDARYRVSADRPIWRLLTHAPLGTAIPGERLSTPVYLIVWVADDVEDGDGDPSIDSNRVLLLYAEAVGTRGARQRAEALIEREAASPPAAGISRHIRVLSW